MTKIMGTKMIARREVDGKTREVHEIELDGLPSVEVEVAIPLHTSRIKDEDKRAERVRKLVLKAAEDHVKALVSDHAG